MTLALSFLLSALGVCALSCHLGYPPEQAAAAFPGPLLAWLAAGVLGALGSTHFLWFAGPEERRPARLLLAIYLPMLALLWLLPAIVEGTVRYVIVALCAVGILLLANPLEGLPGHPTGGTHEDPWRSFLSAGLRLLVPTLVLAWGLYRLGMRLGGSVQPLQLGGALAVGLVASVVVLGLLLFLPERLLTAAGVARPVRILAMAGLFALVHWPDPVLAAVAGLGMLLWAAVYTGVPSLPAAAVSMAVLGSLYTQVLPEDFPQRLATEAELIERLGPGPGLRAFLGGGGERYRGFLDRVDLEREGLVTRGWAGDAGSGTRWEQILVDLDGSLTAPACEPFERPDVRELHPQLPADSGFTCRLPLAGAPGTRTRPEPRRELRAFARYPDGTVRELGYLAEYR